MYIYDVVLRDGLVRLDWHDFETRASEAKPAVAVKVDEPLGISELTIQAIGEVGKSVKGALSSVIVLFSYKKSRELLMEELGGLHEIFNRLVDEKVDLVWGIQRVDEEIANDRCVSAFAFEKR